MPAGLLSAEAAQRVSDALRRSSYTVDGIAQLIGADAVAGLARGRPSLARQALVGDRSPRATLARLLLLGDDVAVDEAADALPAGDAAPLLQRDGGVVRSVYDIAPHADESHDWWVVSDRTDPDGEEDAGVEIDPCHPCERSPAGGVKPCGVR